MTNPVLDDQRMDQVVHGWLHEDDEPAPDRSEQVGRIMDHVDATKQRRRWWPLIPFGRRAMHSADDGDASPQTRYAPRRLVSVSAFATIAILVVGGSLLLYSAGVAPPPVAPGASALLMTSEDAELFDRRTEIWSDKALDAAAVLEAYAPDAVHTALWLDKAERFSGADEIAAQIRRSLTLSPQAEPSVRLPDTLLGERRYLQIVGAVGGMPCVYWIAKDRITRHDCILPALSSPGPWLQPGEPPADVTREELAALNLQGWGGDRSALDQAISPDIIHMVAYDNETRTVDGIDAYALAASHGAPGALIDNIDLPAPEGELRWADYSTVGGGSLCTYWVKEGQIARHDCIVPLNGQ